MRLPPAPFSPSVFDAARLARDAAMPFGALREQIKMFEDSPIRRVMERMQRDDAMRQAMLFQFEALDRFHAASNLAQVQGEQDRQWRSKFSSFELEQVQAATKLAQKWALPTLMEQFRTSEYHLTKKMLSLQSLEVLRLPECVDVFNRTSAMSDLLAESMRVGHELREIAQIYKLDAIPDFERIADYRNFLDAAGLRLPRWPHMRLLSTAEKRRRLRARLKENAEPRHVKRAKSLVYRYEMTLREIIDAAMAEVYGEDWAETRLPLCDCKDLLGKWRKRGGEALDHADYAHYERIMSHSEHFNSVFEAGFDDPDALATLVKNAGRLRAASHHPRAFTLEDLRDLRLTWRLIEVGLLAFTNDYELGPWA